jgi:hypothetical protein
MILLNRKSIFNVNRELGTACRVGFVRNLFSGEGKATLVHTVKGNEIERKRKRKLFSDPDTN